MSWLLRRLDGADYAIRLGWRNVLLLALTLSWPFLLMGLIGSSGCQGSGGACGALAMVLTMVVKPLVYIVFMVSLVPIVVPRLRDGEAKLLLLVPIAALMLMGTGFWMLASAPSVMFMLGAVSLGVPPVVVAGFAVLLALSFLPSSRRTDDEGHRRGQQHSLALSIFVIVLSVLLVAQLLMFALSFASPKLAIAMLLSPAGIAFGLATGLAWQLLLDVVPLIALGFCYFAWTSAGRPGVGTMSASILAVCAGLIAAAAVALLAIDLFNFAAALWKAVGPQTSPVRPMMEGPLQRQLFAVPLMLQAASWLRLAQIVILLGLPFVASWLLASGPHSSPMNSPATVPSRSHPRSSHDGQLRMPPRGGGSRQGGGFGRRNQFAR